MPSDDHQQICELVHRYALGIDTRDWAMFRSIFADEITIDFSSYREQPATTIGADDWVARVQPVFLGLAATQHAMFNPIVEIDGDAATCIMAMRATHALEHGHDDAWFTIGGYYRDTFVRIGGGWRITGVTLVVLWRRGDESIMSTAARRGTAARARPSAE
jgi:hypothetical protein